MTTQREGNRLFPGNRYNEKQHVHGGTFNFASKDIEFVTNSYFLIQISLQPNIVALRNFKL